VREVDKLHARNTNNGSKDNPVSLDARLQSWRSGPDFITSALLLGLFLTFLIYPDGIWFQLKRAGLDVEELSLLV
jgi:hypothetical protein